MKRRTGFSLILAACVALAVASTAYACASLATLYLNKKVATPGTVVNALGKNYGNTVDGDPRSASQVEIRLDSRNGRLLWRGPVSDRTVRASFRAPKTTAGYHTLLAVQKRSDGSPFPGTPGRASIKMVRGPAQAGGAAAWGSVKPEQPGGTGGASPAVGELPAPVTLGGLALALALAGSGVLFLAGGARMGRRAGSSTIAYGRLG